MAEVTLLELEIYRKMIECEERRWGHKEIAKVQESMEQVTKHRTFVGDIRIRDCDEEGKHVIVENAGNTEVSARGYVHERHGHHHRFEFDGDSTWGTNGNVVTRLYNAQGVEIANFEVISI
uniref:LTD domain-containing protein n=1 Tax=Angiostrongylus cantonensis TaxID=6313 RepID=A0A0K0CT66_ANGCA